MTYIRIMDLLTKLVLLIAALVLVGACMGRFGGAALSGAVFHDAVFKLPAAPEDKFIVLTIDDAPSSRTEEILDILAAHEVKATFFVHTEQIDTEARDAALQRAATDGHDLAHHMPADAYARGQSREAFRAAFKQAHERLALYGSAAKPYFRPPMAAYHSPRMDPVLEEFGYHEPLAALGSKRRYILGTVLPWDATALTNMQATERNHFFARNYARQTATLASSGAIVVFHDGEERGRAQRLDATLISLPLFLERAKADGYEVLSLSEAIARLEAKKEN